MKSVCNHRAPPFWVCVDVEVSPWGDTEQQIVDQGSQWTFDYSKVGQWVCTQCGFVQYPTGLWKRFFEEGIPCPGSERHYPYGPLGPYQP